MTSWFGDDKRKVCVVKLLLIINLQIEIIATMSDSYGFFFF